MSLSDAWQEHRDSLTRIRTQLSDTKSPVQKVRSPTRSPRGGITNGRKSHSPYGKYRQSTPPYLPRIDTPPEHDQKRKPSNLRGNRYEVVPPVREARGQDSRNTDYDSWGEESGDDSEADPAHYMPQPYPVPYPFPPQPQVVWGAPFPVYYPPPPPQNKSKRRRKNENDYPEGRRKNEQIPGQSRPPLAERYEDVNRSVPSKNSKKKQNRVHFTPGPAVPNGFYGYPTAYSYPNFYGGEDPYKKQKKDSKYKYIHPRDTPYSAADIHGQNAYNRFKDDPERLMSYYMSDHPLFAENLVDSLVNQFLDEMIPDVLIDVLNHIGHMPDSDSSPLSQIRDDIMAEELPDMMHGIVKDTLSEMVDEYMLYTQTDKDPLESFLNRLMDDAVREATSEIVRDTVKGMARDYVEVQHNEIIFDDVFGDFMLEIGPELINEAMVDMIAEDFIRDVVIESELADEVPEIAKEVLSHYDTKVMRRELKEVSSHAGDKLMESIILDYLLSMIANQGRVWTESDHANKYMDDMISSILLEQVFNVTCQRRKTVANKPLRKLHEKVVTDVALDVLLQQLTASLDEDLYDVDEYERGVTVPGSKNPSFKSISK